MGFRFGLVKGCGVDVKVVPIGALKRYPGNPRKNEAGVAQLAAVIREFGWRQPIVADADGVIIVGDTRYQAAKALKLREVPVHYATNLSPAQIRAYRIADNRVHENSDWEDALLRVELEALQADGFDLSLTALEDMELNELLAEALAPRRDPERTPEPPADPVSRPGDVWLLGEEGHRLACGDSTSRMVVADLLGEDVPSLMVTDPPYGVNYDPTWRAKWRQDEGGAKGVVANDDQPDWRAAWALFPGKVAYIWHGGLHQPEIAASLRAVRFTQRAQIIWVKHRLAISRGNYHWQHEPCMVAAHEDATPIDLAIQPDHEAATYAVRDGETSDWIGGRKQSSVWFIEHARSETGHGTQKPVECMRRPIVNNSVRGAFVYEPFSGSGTTIIAAELTGRRCLAVELMPAYVDVAVRRWQEFTGKQATLRGTRKTFAKVRAEREKAAAAAPAPAPAAPARKDRAKWGARANR